MKMNGKAVNLNQLAEELTAAGIAPSALGTSGDDLYTYGTRTATRVEIVKDGAETTIEYEETGVPVELPEGAAAVVAAHVAMRDKTDAEYATEFQATGTTATRQQQIRDILAGLLPRDKVPM